MTALHICGLIVFVGAKRLAPDGANSGCGHIYGRVCAGEVSYTTNIKIVYFLLA